MLALAHAVMTDARLLLVDEASLGLAPLLVAALFDSITRLPGEGRSVFSSSSTPTWPSRWPTGPTSWRRGGSSPAARAAKSTPPAASPACTSTTPGPGVERRRASLTGSAPARRYRPGRFCRVGHRGHVTAEPDGSEGAT